MEKEKVKAIWFLNKLTDERLTSALDYLRFLYDQEDHPLDDFDYELAKRADDNIAGRTMEEILSSCTPIEEVMEKCGLTYEDLQNYS